MQIDMHIKINLYIQRYIDPGCPSRVYTVSAFILNVYAGAFLEASWDKESAQVAKVWKG